MFMSRRGALLSELLLALVLLGIGLAPAAWLLARAERLTGFSRTRERVARAGLGLLADAPRMACAATSGALTDSAVTIRWTAAGDSLRTVTAEVLARHGGLADTLVTRVACP